MSTEPSPADLGSGLQGYVCLLGHVPHVFATAVPGADLEPHVERTVSEGFRQAGANW